MLRIFLFFLILLNASNVCAVEFDIWKTGLSRQEITKLAKHHNIPLAKPGVYHAEKTFNAKYVTGATDRFYYTTELIGHRAMVTLLLSPKKGGYGQFLYEIEVTFTELLKNKDLKPYLIELLEGKYGSSTKRSNFFQKFDVWRPEENAEVKLVSITNTLQLKYTDLKIKLFAEKLAKSTSTLPPPQKHQDVGKF